MTQDSLDYPEKASPDGALPFPIAKSMPQAVAAAIRRFYLERDQEAKGWSRKNFNAPQVSLEEVTVDSPDVENRKQETIKEVKRSWPTELETLAKISISIPISHKFRDFNDSYHPTNAFWDELIYTAVMLRDRFRILDRRTNKEKAQILRETIDILRSTAQYFEKEQSIQLPEDVHNAHTLRSPDRIFDFGLFDEIVSSPFRTNIVIPGRRKSRGRYPSELGRALVPLRDLGPLLRLFIPGVERRIQNLEKNRDIIQTEKGESYYRYAILVLEDIFIGHFGDEIATSKQIKRYGILAALTNTIFDVPEARALTEHGVGQILKRLRVRSSEVMPPG